MSVSGTVVSIIGVEHSACIHMVGCWESGGDFLRAENAPNIKSLGCRDNIDACVCNCQRPNSSDDTNQPDDTNHERFRC